MYLSLQLPDENPNLGKHMRDPVIVVYNQQYYVQYVTIYGIKSDNTVTHVYSSLQGVT